MGRYLLLFQIIWISIFQLSSSQSFYPTSQPTVLPTSQPSIQPTCRPTKQPTSIPTFKPSSLPSVNPSSQPSLQPTTKPSSQPVNFPTSYPSSQPRMRPTAQPSRQPTSQPTNQPLMHPTSQPTSQPYSHPTVQPSSQQSSQPSFQPAIHPTSQPSDKPTTQPSSQPVHIPTSQPSSQPLLHPTSQPSSQPYTHPTVQPSTQPSSQPSFQPAIHPTSQPSVQPTSQPSSQPVLIPTSQPSTQPAMRPTSQPSRQPTGQPSSQPVLKPTSQPSSQPYTHPTVQPSTQPSSQPSFQPAIHPTSQPSVQPTSQPSSQPVLIPTSQPSTQPAMRPTSQPSRQPTGQPSSQPVLKPTSQPSSQPYTHPTVQPSTQPSSQPSFQPAIHPTSQPTRQPSSSPSRQPRGLPTSKPSSQPSKTPTNQPSRQPTDVPTDQPASSPTSKPSHQTTSQPSAQPYRWPTSQPSIQPTRQPSGHPTVQPTTQPSNQPVIIPTSQPSHQPSSVPSQQPVDRPSSQPTSQPILRPTSQPSIQPTCQPSNQPMGHPTCQPTVQPSVLPTAIPSSQPSSQPSHQPMSHPTSMPSMQPTSQPTHQPSSQPSRSPTIQPSSFPSSQPSSQPSRRPSLQPFADPSSQPTTCPSSQPSTLPTCQPSSRPSTQPVLKPTAQPSRQPSRKPSHCPSSQPTCYPTRQPSIEPSNQPSRQPLTRPSTQPSSQPSQQPTKQPTGNPTRQPAAFPTSDPSSQPSIVPSVTPTEQPTSKPTLQPTKQPTTNPSRQPSGQPSDQPSHQPSSRPSFYPTDSPSNQPSTQPSTNPTPIPSQLSTQSQWMARFYEEISNRTVSVDSGKQQLLYYELYYHYQRLVGSCMDWTLFLLNTVTSKAVSMQIIKSISLTTVKSLHDHYEVVDGNSNTVTCSEANASMLILSTLERLSRVKYQTSSSTVTSANIPCSGRTWQIKMCQDTNSSMVFTAPSICIDCPVNDPCLARCSNARYLQYISPCLPTNASCFHQNPRYRNGLIDSIHILSAIVKDTSTYPSIVDMVQSSSSINSITVSLRLSSAGQVACGAFQTVTASSDLSLDAIYRQETLAVTASNASYVDIILRSLIPATAYNIYCGSFVSPNTRMPLDEVLQTGAILNASTSCCKKVILNAKSTSIPNNENFVDLLLLSINHPTSQDLQITISCKLNSYFVNGVLTPSQLNLKNSLTYSSDLTVYQIGVSFLSSGLTAGEYTVRASIAGLSAADFTVVYQVNGVDCGGYLTFDVYDPTNETPPAPKMISAVSNPDRNGGLITVLFDSPTNYASDVILSQPSNLVQSFNCSAVLKFQGDLNSLCSWSADGTSILISSLYLPHFTTSDFIHTRGLQAYNSKLSSLFSSSGWWRGFEIGLRSNTVRSACTSSCHQLPYSASTIVRLTISDAVTSILPVKAPTTLGKCNSLMIVFTNFQSFAPGFPLFNITVTVSSLQVKRRKLARINQYFLKNYTMLPPSPLPSTLFDINAEYAFHLSSCNILGNCSSTFHFMTVLNATAIPSIQYLSPYSNGFSSTKSLYRYEWLTLIANVSTTHCQSSHSNEAVQRSPTGLQYAWTVYRNNLHVTDLLFVSNLPNIFKLQPFQLAIGSTYSVYLTVYSNNSHWQPTTSLAGQLYVKNGPIIAVLEVEGNAKVIDANQWFWIDASASFDSNTGSIGNDLPGLRYLWTCQDLHPNITSECVVCRNWQRRNCLEVDSSFQFNQWTSSSKCRARYVQSGSTSSQLSNSLNATIQFYVTVADGWRDQYQNDSDGLISGNRSSTVSQTVSFVANSLRGSDPHPLINASIGWQLPPPSQSIRFWSIELNQPVINLGQKMKVKGSLFIPSQSLNTLHSFVRKSRSGLYPNAEYSLNAINNVTSLPDQALQTPILFNIQPQVLQNLSNHVLPFNFLIFSQSLRSGISYDLTLTIRYTSSESSKLKLSIYINSPPTGGSLSVSPASGVEASTSFSLLATAWYDGENNLPLTFEFGYYSYTPVHSDRTDWSTGFTPPIALTIRSESSSEVTILPSITSQDSNVTVSVKVFDCLDAQNEAIYAVLVHKSAVSSAQQYYVDLYGLIINASYAVTGDYRGSKQITGAVSSMLNAVNCSLAPKDCISEFNRYPCSQSSHSCGECLPNSIENEGTDDEMITRYIGVEGSSNSLCIPVIGTFNGSGGTSGGTGKYCIVQSDCAPYFEVCRFDPYQQRSVCHSVAKSCPMDSCSGHGQCSFQNKHTGESLQACPLSDLFCDAVCVCSFGYHGDDCSFNDSLNNLMMHTRASLIREVTSVFQAENLPESIQSMSSSSLVSKIGLLYSVSQSSSHSDMSQNTAMTEMTPLLRTFIQDLDLCSVTLDCYPFFPDASQLRAVTQSINSILSSMKEASDPATHARYLLSSALDDVEQAALLANATSLLQSLIAVVGRTMLTGQSAVQWITTDYRVTIATPSPSTNSSAGLHPSLVLPLTRLEQYFNAQPTSFVIPNFELRFDNHTPANAHGIAFGYSTSSWVFGRLAAVRSGGASLLSVGRSNPLHIGLLTSNDSLQDIAYPNRTSSGLRIDWKCDIRSVDRNHTDYFNFSLSSKFSIKNLNFKLETIDQQSQRIYLDGHSSKESCEVQFVVGYNQPVELLPPYENVTHTRCYDRDHFQANYSCLTHPSAATNQLVQCPGNPGVIVDRCPLINRTMLCNEHLEAHLDSLSPIVLDNCVAASYTEQNLSCRCLLRRHSLMDSLDPPFLSSPLIATEDAATLNYTASFLPITASDSFVESQVVVASMGAFIVLLLICCASSWTKDYFDLTQSEKSKSETVGKLGVGVSDPSSAVRPIEDLVYRFDADDDDAVDNQKKRQGGVRAPMDFRPITSEQVNDTLPEIFRKSFNRSDVWKALHSVVSEFKVHHRCLSILFNASLPFHRVYRTVALAAQIITFILFLTLLWEYTDPDDGSCGRITSERRCIQDQSSYDPHQTKCYWVLDRHTCYFRQQDTLDLWSMAVTGIIAAIVTLPLDLSIRYLLMWTSIPSKATNTREKIEASTEVVPRFEASQGYLVQKGGQRGRRRWFGFMDRSKVETFGYNASMSRSLDGQVDARLGQTRADFGLTSERKLLCSTMITRGMDVSTELDVLQTAVLQQISWGGWAASTQPSVDVLDAWGMDGSGNFTRSTMLMQPRIRRWYEVEDRADVIISQELENCRDESSRELQRLLFEFIPLVCPDRLEEDRSPVRLDEERDAMNRRRLLYLFQRDLLSTVRAKRILDNKFLRDAFHHLPTQRNFSSFRYRLLTPSYSQHLASIHRYYRPYVPKYVVFALLFMWFVVITVYVGGYYAVNRSSERQTAWWYILISWILIDMVWISSIETLFTHCWLPSRIFSELERVRSEVSETIYRYQSQLREAYSSHPNRPLSGRTEGTSYSIAAGEGRVTGPISSPIELLMQSHRIASVPQLRDFPESLFVRSFRTAYPPGYRRDKRRSLDGSLYGQLMDSRHQNQPSIASNPSRETVHWNNNEYLRQRDYRVSVFHETVGSVWGYLSDYYVTGTSRTFRNRYGQDWQASSSSSSSIAVMSSKEVTYRLFFCQDLVLGLMITALASLLVLIDVYLYSLSPILLVCPWLAAMMLPFLVQCMVIGWRGVMDSIQWIQRIGKRAVSTKVMDDRSEGVKDSVEVETSGDDKSAKKVPGFSKKSMKAGLDAMRGRTESNERQDNTENNHTVEEVKNNSNDFYLKDNVSDNEFDQPMEGDIEDDSLSDASLSFTQGNELGPDGG